jgi:amino acid transporter
MDELIGQIQGQLETLEDMSNGIEELNKDVRNFKIGIAAVLLSLISITAVVAQLISTLDINMQLRIKERTFLILLGFIIGIFATIVIYVLPGFRHSKK